MLGIFLSSAGYGHDRIENMLFEQKEEKIPEFESPSPDANPRHRMGPRVHRP